jgi:serine/threonine protein phosphatase PrpC
MKLEVGSVCDRGLSAKRPVNEDRALVRADHGLFVVCDGVGGHNSGEVASQLAIDTIEEALENGSSDDVLDLLERAIQYANRDIYETATSRPEFDGMATTVALLYLDSSTGRAIIGHAGDSRVYRFDGRRLHRETYDHTDLDDAIRAGRLTPDQAVAMGKQNTINRALGIENEVQAEFKSIPLADTDAFLLCSDGVTRHIPDPELEAILSDGLSPSAACEEIRARCYGRGAEDNLTAIVVSLPGRPAARLAGAYEAPQRIEVPVGGPDRVDDRDGARAGGRQRRSGIGWFGATVLVLLTAAGAFYAGRVSHRWLPAPAPAEEVDVVAAREAYERGDLPTARQAFYQLGAREPGRAEYQFWLGRIAAREGDGELAVKYLERAVSLDPKLQDAYPQLAAAYMLLGKPDQAAATLERYVLVNKATEASSSGTPPL